MLLAVGPQLISIQPDADAVLEAGETRNSAPRELVFRFDSGPAIDPNSLGGIRITRAGTDGQLGTADDVKVDASRNLGLRGNDVVVRFGENLPDDHYRIDIVGTGGGPLLQDVDGSPFDADPNLDDIQNFSLEFRLDLGTQVEAVVPQPITRLESGVLTQAANQIEVYFDDTDLDPALATTRENYQLILTQDTIENTDDVIFLPIEDGGVQYDETEGKAILTFADALHELADGGGSFRLRIGTADDPFPAPDGKDATASDPGDSFATALKLGELTSQSQIVTSIISNVGILNLPQFPGSPSEPGHEDPEFATHVLGGDFIDGISVIEYNFQPTYGGGFANLITEPQKQRAREALEIYASQLGIDIVETQSSGVTVATGVGTAFGADLMLLDNSVNWNDEFSASSTQGAPSFFESVLAGFGAVFGFSSFVILPPDFGSGDARFSEPAFEATFPREHQIVHGQHVFRPDSLDIDLYEFTTGAQSGLFSAEIFAERLGSPSNLDSVLRLYQATPSGMQLVAQNDDYFSEDSFLQLQLSAETRYYVGVSSTGNDEYDPTTAASGFGGTSEGQYELRLDFRPQTPASLADVGGVAFDGDGDGTPGGVYNFWFRAGAASGTETPHNEQQQFDLTGATGGSFRIVLDGESTTALPYNAPLANVKAVIENLSSISAGDILVAGGPLPDGPVTIEFAGSVGSRDLPEITINRSGLTGGTPTVTTLVDGRIGTRVIFVDKTDTHADTDADVGSLANPYGTIHDALNQDINGLPKMGAQSDPNAARPGDIVRIVGNGSSAATSIPYKIGVNSSNQPLADGTELEIPRDVTVMVDAGAAFQLRRGGILVGSTAVAIDNSRAAFQVLGTPDSNVIFTSTSDSDLSGTNGMRGDWGGILFAGEFDEASGRSRYEDEGIFFNHVSHADIRFGGGIVNVNSVPQEVAPIDIRDARPTIVFNRIVRNGVAAISATPDSFEETNFHAPKYQAELFTSDYARVGPDIQDNFVAENSINGLFVKLVTRAGTELRKLTVSGRWNDTDIAHVLTEVLEVQGTPGGNITGPTSTTARPDARLAIDPSVIVKLDGARIETGLGAQLIAEGTAGRQVIFTSIFDDRYGASGSFDTSNNGLMRTAAAGDWGGIYVGHSSSASLDHTFITYAGGLAPIEGGFKGFNAIEIHQADARITNSTLVSNASGLGGTGELSRAGRGVNGAAVIFVRGAQPIIIGNEILASGATNPSLIGPATSANDLVAAISVNANSLNLDRVTDPGRTTGRIMRYPGGLGNQGPLIRDNRLDDNDVNGMVVRGEALDTEGVWDDTNIVHVLYDSIHVSNYHTNGGLRLESNTNESLVVKLGGFVGDAGFDATGRALDIEDRIGGSLQIIGQPGRPVILTSLTDNSVGAGMKRDGSFQNETIRPGMEQLPEDLPNDIFNIDFNYSAEVETNPMLVAGFEEAARFWESRITDPISISFDVVIADTGSEPYASASADGAAAPYDDVILALQADAAPDEIDLLSRLPLFNQLTVQGPEGAFEVAPTLIMGRPSAKALGFALAPVPSQTKTGRFRDGQINMTELFSRGDTVDAYASVMIHEIGHAMGFGSSVPEDGEFGGGITLTTLDLFRMAPGAGADDFTNNPRVVDPDREQVFYDGGLFDPVGIDIFGLTKGDIPLSRGTEPHPDDGQPSHWRANDAVNMNGIVLGIMDPGAGSFVSSNDERALGLIGWDFNQFGYGETPAPGDWQGIQLDEFSHDRNVDVVTELESSSSDAIGANGIPNRAEFVGSLAEGEFLGDENLRLGFEINGAISAPSDVDVYSFEGTAGTQVWLDADRTTFSLDSIIELIDANGNVLARSNDSLSQDQISINSTVSARPLGQGFYQTDHYSLNPKDAGMRVTLPGPVGTRGTYFVRVRSASENLADTGAGVTQGAYELNIRVRAVDEVPGTVVKYADIRYAKNGIDVAGLVKHSPLQTEFVEPGDIASFDTALNVGDPFQADRGEISISGTLEPIPNDVLVWDRVTQGVDWYRFSLSESVPGVIFDIDYADGTGNPDTHLAVYRVGISEGPTDDEEDDYAIYDLIYFGDASNVNQDLGDMLTAGTFGGEDPFIGPVYPTISLDGQDGTEVFHNGDDGPDIVYLGDYLVAVTSEGVRPRALIDQLLFPDPIEAGRRIANTEFEQTLPVDLTMATYPFTLNEMTLYVATGDGTALSAFNPFTGQITEVSDFGNARPLVQEDNTGQNIASLAMRADGSLYSLSLGVDDDTSGNFLLIDWAQNVNDGGVALQQNVTNIADDEIVTFHAVPNEDPTMPPMFEESDDGIQFRGMTFALDAAYAVGNRGESDAIAGSMPPADYLTNAVYRIDGYQTELDGNDTDPGTAINVENNDSIHEPTEDPENPPPFPFRGAFTDIIEVGHFDTTVGGPGGTIEGIAEMDGTFYGVSDAGGIYSLMPGALDTEGSTTFIAAIPGASFSGLTFGPAGLGMGSTLFAVTTSGSLHAFDTAGNRANVFVDGASRIDLTDEAGEAFTSPAQGLTFSTLDQNLWVTNDLDGRRPAIQSNSPVVTFASPYLPPGGRVDSAASFFAGNGSTFEQYNSDFNYPGGAKGEFVFTSSHLANVTASDKPYLSFDYTLRTENDVANDACSDYNYGETCDPTPRNFHQDGFRVYATSETDPSPADWVLLGTNNSSTVFNGDGNPERRSGGSEFFRLDNNGAGFGVVQELFDNSRLGDDGADEDDSVVRQALIPIGEFAGNELVSFRFEFSTEASFANADVWSANPADCLECYPGDAFGNPLRVPERTPDGLTDNQVAGAGTADHPNFEVSVGNVFFGSAERGRQFNTPIFVDDVTGVAEEPVFVRYVGARQATYTGSYQLSIRPAYHDGVLDLPPRFFDSNEILTRDVIGSTGFGEQNRFRDQGQLLLHSNRISDSAEYGIRIDATPRITTGAAKLVAANSNGLVRGPVIENNVIVGSGIAGIFYGNDTSGASTSFGRAINNTIVGVVGNPAGRGIQVGPNASPTLLNNIIAYTDTAISLASSSISTVITGQLFHGNKTNGPLGVFPIISTVGGLPISGDDGLFRNPGNGNFLLTDDAVAIDSAVNSQEDRPSIVSVLSSLGIDSFSPILAPERDALGQLRIDEPMIESPPGLGSEVIKDRGAIERADFSGPRAELLTPVDNGSNDLDEDINEIYVMDETFSFFEIRLFDLDTTGNSLFGVGLDDATIDANAVTLRRDDTELVLGFNYNLSHDSTNDILRIIPLAGVWIDGVYSVELSSSIADLATNPLADDNRSFLIGINRDPNAGGSGGWHNADNPTDVNDDGFVVAQDVNIIITELNQHNFSDETGLLDSVAQSPPFYDVDDDGFISPTDAINVINDIQRNTVMAPLSFGVVAEAGQSELELASLPLASVPENGDAANASTDHALDVAIRTYRPAQLTDVGGLAQDDASVERADLDAIFADWA